MSKLEETNLMIDYMAKSIEKGSLKADNAIIDTTMLMDIAKSLAIIADKLCDTESEDKT